MDGASSGQTPVNEDKSVRGPSLRRVSKDPTKQPRQFVAVLPVSPFSQVQGSRSAPRPTGRPVVDPAVQERQQEDRTSWRKRVHIPQGNMWRHLALNNTYVDSAD